MGHILLLLPLLLFSSPATAHPAVAVAFDTENLQTIEGVVTDVFWRNPHIVLTVERTLDGGGVDTWKAESGSTNALQRVGIGPDIVSVGDRVSLFGALSRRGLNSMAAYTLSLIHI